MRWCSMDMLWEVEARVLELLEGLMHLEGALTKAGTVAKPEGKVAEAGEGRQKSQAPLLRSQVSSWFPVALFCL